MTHIDVPVAPALTVGEIAAEAGVAASAVRFYDKYNIIHAGRNSRNQRRFTEDAVCRISVAKLAQRTGLTIREIAELFADLPEHATGEDWTRIGDRLITEAEDRLSQLKELIDMLGTDTKLCEADAVLADRE